MWGRHYVLGFKSSFKLEAADCGGGGGGRGLAVGNLGLMVQP